MESGKQRPGKAFLWPSERRFVSPGKGDSPEAGAVMHPPALCIHRDNYRQLGRRWRWWGVLEGPQKGRERSTGDSSMYMSLKGSDPGKVMERRWGTYQIM